MDSGSFYFLFISHFGNKYINDIIAHNPPSVSNRTPSMEPGFQRLTCTRSLVLTPIRLGLPLLFRLIHKTYAAQREALRPNNYSWLTSLKESNFQRRLEQVKRRPP